MVRLQEVNVHEYQSGSPVPIRQVLHSSLAAVVVDPALKYAQLEGVEGHPETEIGFSVAGPIAFFFIYYVLPCLQTHGCPSKSASCFPSVSNA